jgi:hypothetical protein
MLLLNAVVVEAEQEEEDVERLATPVVWADAVPRKEAVEEEDGEDEEEPGADRKADAAVAAKRGRRVRRR